MTPEASFPDVRLEALRLVTNGVYVLSACGADTLHAAAVTWASQVSFLPPLVLVALRRNSHLAQAVRRAHRFALNIIAEEQQELAGRFFEHRTAPAEAEELDGFPIRMTIGRCPLFIDAPAWVECKLVAEPVSPGDHALMLGEVTGAGVRRAATPMVLFNTPWSYGGLR
jgi:flavin reductase (DIM6/NTAB) family NADH-FMN oxidoreductase RutF